MMSAMRPAQDGKGFIVRLFECTGKDRRARLSFPISGASAEVSLKPFEILTLRLNPSTGEIAEDGILE